MRMSGCSVPTAWTTSSRSVSERRYSSSRPDAQPLRPQLDLPLRLLAGDIQHPERTAQLAADLEHQSGPSRCQGLRPPVPGSPVPHRHPGRGPARKGRWQSATPAWILSPAAPLGRWESRRKHSAPSPSRFHCAAPGAVPQWCSRRRRRDTSPAILASRCRIGCSKTVSWTSWSHSLRPGLEKCRSSDRAILV